MKGNEITTSGDGGDVNLLCCLNYTENQIRLCCRPSAAVDSAPLLVDTQIR